MKPPSPTIAKALNIAAWIILAALGTASAIFFTYFVLLDFGVPLNR